MNYQFVRSHTKGISHRYTSGVVLIKGISIYDAIGFLSFSTVPYAIANIARVRQRTTVETAETAGILSCGFVYCYAIKSNERQFYGTIQLKK